MIIGVVLAVDGLDEQFPGCFRTRDYVAEWGNDAQGRLSNWLVQVVFFVVSIELGLVDSLFTAQPVEEQFGVELNWITHHFNLLDEVLGVRDGQLL